MSRLECWRLATSVQPISPFPPLPCLPHFSLFQRMDLTFPTSYILHRPLVRSSRYNCLYVPGVPGTGLTCIPHSPYRNHARLHSVLPRARWAHWERWVYVGIYARTAGIGMQYAFRFPSYTLHLAPFDVSTSTQYSVLTCERGQGRCAGTHSQTVEAEVSRGGRLKDGSWDSNLM